MTPSPRCVVDTNVLISAVLTRDGKPNQAVRETLLHGVLLATVDTLRELETRLERTKFERYLTHADREAYLALIQGAAHLVEITELVEASRDPDDDKFLALAVSGNADVIISGDKDLKVLHPFRGIPILTPAEFLEDYRPAE